MIEAALAGVTSITLADDVITQVVRAAGSESAPSLSELVDCSGVRVLPFDTELPKGVHAAILKSADSAAERVLAANLGARSVSLTFSGVKIDIPAFGTRWIEPATPQRAV